MSRSAFVIGLMAVLVVPGPAASEAAPPGPVATLALSLRLYGEAAAAGDAMGMAVAARLAASIQHREARSWTSEAVAFARETGQAAGDGGPAAPVTLDLLTSGAGLSAALLMAEEDEALSDLLYELPPVAIRGGVSVLRADLRAGAGESWTIPFSGQSPAEIAVFPAGDPAPGAETGGMFWSVTDGAGETLCPQHAVATAICSFTPGENGFYHIVIANPSAQAASYLLVTN